ncbi:MAG TPA: hypothetical protein VKD67_08520, partial [Acidimicrobiales bacterium]|nr:hypothetical protein [Acidimicrobiales bacterium]
MPGPEVVPDDAPGTTTEPTPNQTTAGVEAEAGTEAEAAKEEAGAPDAGRRRRSNLVEHGVVSVFTLGVSWPFLRPDRFIAGFDTVAYTAPNLRYTLDAWRDGRLAQWNGRIFGGVTHLGNPQAGALYPLKALALPFGVSRGIAV